MLLSAIEQRAISFLKAHEELKKAKELRGQSQCLNEEWKGEQCIRAACWKSYLPRSEYCDGCVQRNKVHANVLYLTRCRASSMRELFAAVRRRGLA